MTRMLLAEALGTNAKLLAGLVIRVIVGGSGILALEQTEFAGLTRTEHAYRIRQPGWKSRRGRRAQ